MRNEHDFRARARTFVIALSLDPEDEDPIVELMGEVAEACAKVCDDTHDLHMRLQGGTSAVKHDWAMAEGAKRCADNIRGVLRHGEEKT